MNMPFLAGLIFLIFDIYLVGRALGDFKKATISLECPDVGGRLTDLQLWNKHNIDRERHDSEKFIVGYEFELKGGQ